MKVQPFEKYAKRYEDWFDRNRFAYKSELEAVRTMLPKHGKGVEIGVGSGRFAAPLKINFGIEPSPKMRTLAKKRGIKVIDGMAEKLPCTSKTYDYALMVTTLCFLDDVDAAFKEVHRILKPKGCFVNGFVDKESELGIFYRKHKEENVFYKVAEFYSVSEVIEHLEKANFKNFEFAQTIFHSLHNITSVEPVKPGYGEGSFVVVKAEKYGD